MSFLPIPGTTAFFVTIVVAALLMWVVVGEFAARTSKKDPEDERRRRRHVSILRRVDEAAREFKEKRESGITAESPLWGDEIIRAYLVPRQGLKRSGQGSFETIREWEGEEPAQTGIIKDAALLAFFDTASQHVELTTSEFDRLADTFVTMFYSHLPNKEQTQSET